MSEGDFNADKAAHLFYGMSEEMYEAGFRYDWNNCKSKHEENGDITISFPLLQNGEAYKIKTEGWSGSIGSNEREQV